jgi:hypothetical protein
MREQQSERRSNDGQVPAPAARFSAHFTAITFASTPIHSGPTDISRRRTLAPIRVGDRAQIKLMGHNQIARGRVDSIARAINVANAQPNNQGVANVNPIFTWVRLAQRIPVRIHIDEVPPGVVLSAG